MLEMFYTAQFWVDVFMIIVINLLLSGDNAVVIALACRNLPLDLRKKGILFGVGGAIVLRVILTMFAVNLLTLPYLKLVGALLLLWIGIKLIVPDEEHGVDSIKADTRLLGAIKTILIADLVMSLDNVLGVAAAAKGNVWLLIFGLLISIPLITWSSQLVLKLIDRFPIIIYAGGTLLGYVAGEMLVGESLFKPLMETHYFLHWMVPVFCAVLVLVAGRWLTMRKVAVPEVIDLVDEAVQAEVGEQSPNMHKAGTAPANRS